MPRKPAPQGRRGQQEPTEEELGDGRGWPLLREQQRLRERLPEGEAEAAEHRAQVLVSQGWGALRPWLEHPGQHPGERSQPKTNRSGSDRIAALFDEAA